MKSFLTGDVTAAESWPRISLVTPVYNGAHYLEATIRSVLSQGYPNFEYLIVDGGSTDGTLDIIRNYESQLAGWISERDNGVYDALNKGFARTSGEVMGWLNASDMLQVNGLFVVGSVFRAFRTIEWITGRPSTFNTSGMTVSVNPVARWSRSRYLAGANRYIQQESTYWRRGLWQKAGGTLSGGYGAAGDFELWIRFFRHSQLFSVNALVGGYRIHPDALSSSDINLYSQNCAKIIEHELASLAGHKVLRLFRSIHKVLHAIPKIRVAWDRMVMKRLYTLDWRDLPPLIVDNGRGWELKR